jgi:uncharacterized membrane protein YhhN
MSDLLSHETLDVLRAILAGSSLAFALIYLAFFLGAPQSPLRTTMKTLPIGLLSLVPLTYLPTRDDTLMLLVLTLALGLSALGDFFLALRDQGRFFLLGLGSFFAAHVAYLAVFLPRASTPDGWALAASVGAVAAAGVLLVKLAPRLGRLKAPVFAYFAVIMAMVVAALSVESAPWFLGVGAIVFAISDSLIGVRKFLQPFRGVDAAIWVTYCAAQYMIVAALLAPPGLV